MLTFIYPHVDQETRTVTVRFELNNPGHRLRPGTTATVKLNVPPREIRVLARGRRLKPRHSTSSTCSNRDWSSPFPKAR